MYKRQEVLEDKKIIQSSTKEVCAYGLRQIFSTIFNAGTMLLIGFLMQMLIEAILFTVIYIPVRVYAGGYHASTPQRCWAFSAIMLWICLLYTSRMNVNTQEISHRICYNVPFSSLRFFPRHIHDLLHNTLFLRSVNRSVRNLVLHSFLLVFVLF